MNSMSPEQMQSWLMGAGLMVILAVSAVYLVVLIFYLLTLQKTLKRCSPESCAMQPGLVWLMVIPCFNLIWHFFVVINMAKSLSAEFKKRGIAVEDKPGQTIGLIMCVCPVVAIIPFVGCVAGPAGLVCWIMYWVKIADFSKKLAA